MSTVSSSVRPRVESIDVLRGVIMIVMALDHTRDFFGVPASPTNLASASAALFFTRWITHFCAPVFFLLTGTGASLARGRRTTRELSWLLVTRGLWLIVLDVTVSRFFLQFNIDYHVTFLLVLWALGWSMIALSALVFLPPTVVTLIGVTMIATHNLFDRITAASLGAFGPIWSILHAPGFVHAQPPHIVFVGYPLIPWIGVTAVGYGLGQLFDREVAPEKRRSTLLRFGIALTAAFIALRWLNVYGDPSPWVSIAQRPPLFTWLSFLNTTKYPPSLLFLLMTLGPALLFLRLVDTGTPRVLQPALVFGKVPMFYFLLHFFVIHLLAVLVCYLRYSDAHWMVESPTLAQYPFTQPPGWGFSLPLVYLAWTTVVLLVYPACRWFAAVKSRRRDWWLSYL